MKRRRDPDKWYLIVRVPADWRDPLYKHTKTTVNLTILQAIREWLKRRGVGVAMPKDKRTQRFHQ